ncbi:MAG: tetratricopeptide repeat protein, partial [Anaerolineales bacterium]|nr:tetratricopeptide repeat protein [Anaerolineales bacterium]
LELGFAFEKLCPPFGDCSEGYSAVNAWKEGKLDNFYFSQKGETARHNGKFLEAAAWYQRAQNLGMDLHSTIIYTEYLYWTAIQDGERAKNALAKAVEIDSGWFSEMDRFLAWYRYGRLLSDRDDWQLAEEILQKAIEIHPESHNNIGSLSEAYRFLARSQTSQNKHEQAMLNYQKAIDLNPRNVWAYVSFGRAMYIMDVSNIDLTDKLFLQALDLAGNDPLVWRNIIWSWLDFNQIQQANRYCDLAFQFGVEIEELFQCPVE